MTEVTDGAAIARERITLKATERTGMLDLGNLALTVLPEALFTLKHLRRLNLGFGIFDDDRSWVQSGADIASNEIRSSLGRLTELSEHEVLSVSGCKLTSLGGIATPNTLRALDCSLTEVRDLQPLAGLTALQMFDCSGTKVGDLEPLAGLSALQEVDCSFSQVSDLGPLAGLTALQVLWCYDMQVNDPKPLAGLSSLRSLHCSDTQVSDLGPLAGLTARPGTPVQRHPGEQSFASGQAHRAPVARLLRLRPDRLSATTLVQSFY